MNADMDDARLILQIRAGKTRLYGQLVARYQAPLFSMLLRCTRSEDVAFDLAQETFVRAFEKLDGFDAQRRFFPWLYTLGFNIARDHMRKYRTENRLTSRFGESDDDGALYADTHNAYEHADTQAALEQALALLAPDTREAVLMRHREGFSYQEVADALHIGLSNAKMKIHRGLEQLRRFMNAESI